MSPTVDDKKQELTVKIEKLYKTSDELVDRCAYLKAFANSPLSESEFLLEILNKEKIYQYHQNESNTVLKRLIRKGNQHGRLIAKLVQTVPTKFYKSLLSLTEDDVSQTASLSPSPLSPPVSQNRALRVAGIWHKERPDLSTHQMKIAMFLGRIRGVLTISEKVYQNWGWHAALYARQDGFMENHLVRQIFLLSLYHKYLAHELVFFNNPTLYLCFQKLYDLLAQLIEILVATAKDRGADAEPTQCALGLAISQIKYASAKLISVQYSAPGLFELL